MSPSLSFARSAAALAIACVLGACTNETTDPTGQELQITIGGSGSGQVTVDPAASQSVGGCATSCSLVYTDPTVQVTLTAHPSTGSAFAGWSGGECTGTGTCTVTMSQQRNVTATFMTGNLLTVQISTGGTVNLSPGTESGGTCLSPATAGTCTAFYATNNQLVTLTATPQADHVFAGWAGACTGFSTTCTVTMNQSRNVTAAFAAGHTLTLSMFGHGAVSLSPLTDAGAGADCGNPTVISCFAFYSSSAQQVVLTANPPPGFALGSWSGPCAAGTAQNQCIVTMNQNRAVDANWTVVGGGNSLSINIFGTGSVTLSPNGIAHASATCTNNPTTSSCVAIYSNASQQVTLTAAPSGSGTFVGWRGSCTGTGSCIVTMSAGKNVVAHFSQ